MGGGNNSAYFLQQSSFAGAIYPAECYQPVCHI
jgi:hypothetical protein